MVINATNTDIDKTLMTTTKSIPWKLKNKISELMQVLKRN